MVEWIEANVGVTVAAVVVGASTLVQVSPLKINPWSSLGRMIGSFIGVTAIQHALDEHIRIDDERNIKQCRMRILRFNDEVLQGKLHTKEHFDEVLDDITEYERYCETHKGYRNSKAGMAINNIETTYQDCLRKNSFLHEVKEA